MADGDDREESENTHRDSSADNTDIPNVDDIHLNDEESDNLEEEYLALNSQLDQLDACLDSLEARNDDLVGKLRALLQDSVQVRQELHELNAHRDNGDGDSGDHAGDGDSCGRDSAGDKRSDSGGENQVEGASSK